MNRRRFVCVLTLSISLPGCVEDGSGGSTEQDRPDTESKEGTVTRTETETPEGAVPECHPSMCEGQQLVEVRDEEIPIGPEDSERIDREDDGETCGLTVHIDGEQEYSERIEDYEHLTLTVTSEGEFEEGWVVV